MTDADRLERAQQVAVPVAALVEDMRLEGVRDPLRVAYWAIAALLLECEQLPEVAALRTEVLAIPPAPAEAPPSWDADCWDAGRPYRKPLAAIWVRLCAPDIGDGGAAEILFTALHLVDVGRQLARFQG